MTTEFVQSRRNPPVLIPLPNPEQLPAEVLKARLSLIYTLIETKRGLDKIELEEKENLCAILAGTHRRPRASDARQAELEKELLA